jgi:squalene synthase HpnC
MKTKTPELIAAYQFCQQLAQSHYENFPVASIVLPKRLRQAISVIYAFARTADDFADEGTLSNEQRLQQLDDYRESLLAIGQHNYQGTDPIFIALADVIHNFSLPLKLFEDLLSAFKQDVIKNRYESFNTVLDYCTRSANPVGRLLLYLEGNITPLQLEQSDAICTALQLINFCQDIEQDYHEQDRIYIPQDELICLGLTESDLINLNSKKIAPLLRSLYYRSQQMLASGYTLGMGLSGRIGWEVRAMTLSGIYTLVLLQQQSDDHLLTRPRLGKAMLFKIMANSLSKSYYQHACHKLFQRLDHNR